MNKIRIICLISFTSFFSLSIIGQNERREQLLRQISDIDEEIERLKASLDSSELKDTICYGKTIYTELQPMSNEQFEQFCVQELAKIEEFPRDIEDRVISSCRNEGNLVSAQFCIFHNPKAEEKSQEENKSREERLEKVRNTIKMYQDIVAAIDNELAANGIGIVDDGGNLLVKHLNLKELEPIRPLVQKAKDCVVGKLKEFFGVEHMASIQNENAETVDNFINVTEEITSVIPGADKLTCHYLWRIFKSVPDVGKMLGSGGATVNIYFQRKEAISNLHKYEQIEQELLKKQ